MHLQVLDSIEAKQYIIFHILSVLLRKAINHVPENKKKANHFEDILINKVDISNMQVFKNRFV